MGSVHAVARETSVGVRRFRCSIILNARKAGFCSITPPRRDEASTDTSEDSNSSGGISISIHALATIKDDKTQSITAQSSNRDDALDGYPPTTRYNSIYNDDKFPSLSQNEHKSQDTIKQHLCKIPEKLLWLENFDSNPN
jgi:hypothetical protein